MNTYLSTVHLVGKVPGQITSSGKIAGLGKKGTIWIDKGQQTDGLWLYWLKGYVPEPPVTPPPAATAEAFLVGAGLSVGVNVGGALGTVTNAPSGVPTDTAAGYVRVGLYAPGKSGEAVLKGTPVEGFVIAYGGKVVVRNLENADMPGANYGGEWRGSGSTLAVVQRLALADGKARFDVAITNTSAAPMPSFRYMRVIDPDPSINPDVFNTVNTVEAANRVSATAGAKLTLASSDLNTRVGVQPFTTIPASDPAKVAVRAVGYSHKGDDTLHLVWDFGTVAAGQTVTLSFEYTLA